jgi:hypothetical protein
MIQADGKQCKALIINAGMTGQDGGTGNTGTRSGIEQSVQVLLGAAAADARFRDQPNGVAQVPFAKQSQGIGQSLEQIGAIWFAQCNHNSSAVPLECQWNGVKEILVGGDEYGLLLLCASK